MAVPKASGSSDYHEPIKEMGNPPERIPNRLILCFDGTGNSFQANTQDTNIVKLYDKFNRDSPHQMHYYQPGIGTYTTDGVAVNSSWFGKTKSSFTKTIDQGLATSFESHVSSGYRFLMRYYGPGDRIYIFGFSRGAFTARFLARMVSEVGLLSMGNEELVPFAYQKYYEYVQGQYTTQTDNPDGKRTPKQEAEYNDYLKQKNYLSNFKTTFCRHEGDHEHDPSSKHEPCGIKPHFLGLFDTVSSVGTFDVPFTSTMKLPQVGGTAEHIRHAVAVDEYRVKFKVALLAQDRTDINVKEDVKEVWFPGNHGDVGGGWSATDDAKNEGPTVDVREDSYQLSDISLKWMMDELNNLPGDQPEWNHRYEGFVNNFKVKYDEAIKARVHNPLSWKDRSSWYQLVLWWIMESLPLFKRWEYEWDGTTGEWKYIALPVNLGSGRDIPPDAKFHQSVVDMAKGQKYKPINDVFMKDSGGNVHKTNKLTGSDEKLFMVVPPGGNVPPTPQGLRPHGETQPLRHLEFEMVEDNGYGKDIFSIVRK